MKALQPEMARLKELHKNDKMKFQQELMALYKKKKNPMSLFTNFGPIPVFFVYIKFYL